jgi:tRNA threonylcarbamoyladenosine biosynthesis protein TsaE
MIDAAGRGRLSRTVVSASDAETQRLGEELGRTLEGGTYVLLYGDLGAGKTAFVRGLAKGLGIDPDEVSSPTFTLVQEYRAAVPLHHADLYRVTTRLDVEELGLDEAAAAGAVVAVEWADRRAGDVPAGAVLVTIADEGGDRRRIVVDRQPAPAPQPTR